MNILDSDIYRRPPLNYDWNSISEYALTVDGYALAEQFLRLNDQELFYPLLFTLADTKNPEEYLLKPELL